MHSIPAQARHQFGVFTTAQAYECGWSRSALSRATISGKLIALRRGAFVVAEAPNPGHELAGHRLGQRAVAAALRIPAGAVSHASAVALHGLPLLRIPTLPCLTLPPELRTREAALHVHRQPLASWQLDRNAEISLTSVVRSCLDLTREMGLDAGLVAADAAVHRRLCTVADLDAGYSALRGRAGLPSGRRLLELVNGSSESPLESISRLAMASALPAPRLQARLHALDGRFLARVDFYWPELGVVGEADGRGKYTDDELWNEKARQERLTDRGLVVERWGWSVARRPAVLQARLQQAFRRAVMLRSAGITADVSLRTGR